MHATLVPAKYFLLLYVFDFLYEAKSVSDHLLLFFLTQCALGMQAVDKAALRRDVIRTDGSLSPGLGVRLRDCFLMPQGKIPFPFPNSCYSLVFNSFH